MDTSFIIIIAIAALTIGALFTWLIQRPSFIKQLSVLNERLQQQAMIMEQADNQIKSLQDEKELLIQNVSKAESRSQLLEEEHKSLKRFRWRTRFCKASYLCLKRNSDQQKKNWRRRKRKCSS